MVLVKTLPTQTVTGDKLNVAEKVVYSRGNQPHGWHRSWGGAICAYMLSALPRFKSSKKRDLNA